MIIYFSVFILSFIQGLTEFLPISSSGHLIFLHSILPPLPINDAAFDVMLHAGTLLAVIIFFFGDIREITLSWLRSLGKKEPDVNAKLGWYIVLATIPAAIMGYLFDDFIEEKLRSTIVVAIMLIVIAIFFIVVEKISKQSIQLKSMNWKKALLIGCAQVLAFFPGTSRSGVTIIAGMAANLNREAAVRFSFLISAPIILGANIKKIPALLAAISDKSDLFILLFGFSISYIVGYYVIKYFIIYVKNYSLNIFAYYRITLAVMIALLWMII
ncbi:MAG: undecaprenyl-diphosphatase UppP [bacterium]|nr:undecaprenyl-diphosphatase UppP [bacterium]